MGKVKDYPPLDLLKQATELCPKAWDLLSDIHSRTEALHRDRTAGCREPDDGQCAPEPAVQRPVHPAAAGPARRTAET